MAAKMPNEEDDEEEENLPETPIRLVPLSLSLSVFSGQDSELFLFQNRREGEGKRESGVKRGRRRRP